MLRKFIMPTCLKLSYKTYHHKFHPNTQKLSLIQNKIKIPLFDGLNHPNKNKFQTCKTSQSSTFQNNQLQNHSNNLAKTNYDPWMYYFKIYLEPDMRPWASDTVGRAGMAPFFVVHIAPHAFEKANACFNFASSYIYIHKLLTHKTSSHFEVFRSKWSVYYRENRSVFWHGNQ